MLGPMYETFTFCGVLWLFSFQTATLSTLTYSVYQTQFAVLFKLLAALIQPINQFQQLHTFIIEMCTFGLLTLWLVVSTARCKVRVWSDG